MSVPLLLFMALAVILILLLAWAVRPPKRVLLTVDEVFAALSEERHYARLPQILQSLREEDTEYLRSVGHGELFIRLRAERQRIALGYLKYLEDEYQLLLEASRILAKVAPEVKPMHEFERFKRSVRFVLSCRYLRWRLLLGLQPWSVFGTISDMEGELTLQLEAATASLGERASMAAEFPLFLEKRHNDPE
ncbi:MAG: hypothetical protein WBL63_04815 [Candidatus Acidiferrum sp.]